MERIVTGTYGNEIQPRSAVDRGYTGFLRNLYGITKEECERKLTEILAVTPVDVCNSCKRLLADRVHAVSAIVTGHMYKKDKISGKIVYLPL